jgi:hypothetical protein
MLDRLDVVRPVSFPGEARIDALLGRLDALDGVNVFDEPGVLAAASCGARACFNGHTPSKDPLYRDADHLSAFGTALAYAAFVAQMEADASR